MKPFYIYIILVFTLVTTAQAQVPNAINYQGVARDTTGTPIASATIGLQFSIRDVSGTGTVIYQETQTVTTNSFGLFTVAIGAGTAGIGTFSGINWASAPKFLQVGIDPAGGSSYVQLGAVQLLSVPYALFTNNAGTAQTALYSDSTAKAHFADSTPSAMAGTQNFIPVFTTPTTLGNSLLKDSALGLMYNTAAGLSVGNTKFAYQAPKIAGSNNYFSFVGDSNSNSFIMVSDSTSLGNRGIVLASSQNIASGFSTGDNHAVFLVHNPSVNQFYLTNSVSSWLTVDMTTGAVTVPGMLSKGGGTFKIDHPLDPENKYLYHSFVESPDMMNIYNGNITTDTAGEAIVELPAYFEALNKDFKYQLTVIGVFTQAIIAKKIQNNRFVIKTQLPNVEVSWQVTGVRKDKFANAHRVVPETAKEPANIGKYLHPSEFGKPLSDGIDYGIKTGNSNIGK
jgi:hypothetical protein